MAVTLLLTSCQLPANVTITEGPKELAVAASRPDGTPLCIESLAVYPVANVAAPMWRVLGERGKGCVSRVVYGRVPAGFEQVTAPAALQAGTRYYFAVTAPGVNDGAEFTPARDVRPPS